MTPRSTGILRPQKNSLEATNYMLTMGGPACLRPTEHFVARLPEANGTIHVTIVCLFYSPSNGDTTVLTLIIDVDGSRITTKVSHQHTHQHTQKVFLGSVCGAGRSPFGHISSAPGGDLFTKQRLVLLGTDHWQIRWQADFVTKFLSCTFPIGAIAARCSECWLLLRSPLSLKLRSLTVL